MRRHAKASSAGPTTRQAGSLGRAVRGAFATRGASSDADGSGAPSRTQAGLLAPLALAIALALLLIPTATATAAPLKDIGQFCTQAGAGAGQCLRAEGVAVNRTGAGGVEPGDVYVVEANNNRVQEFSKSGAFVRMWGKNVNSTGGTGFEVCTAAESANCKAGTASAEAGAQNTPTSIAIDQKSGNVYVSSAVSRRIEVYSAKGKFEGAFGWKVKVTGAAEELQLCVVATGCQEAPSTAPAKESAGAFNGLFIAAMAIDPKNGDLWVADGGNHRINEFSLTLNGAEEVTGVSFNRALGWKVNATSPAEELQECTSVSGCKKGTVGAGNGQIDQIRGMAVDADGNVYASSFSEACEVAAPCRVQKFNPDGSFKEVFGPSSGGAEACQLTWTNGVFENANPVSGHPAGQVPKGIAIDPSNQHVFVVRKIGANESDICEFDAEGVAVQRSPEKPIPSNVNSEPTIAIGVGGRLYVEDRVEATWPVHTFSVIPAAPAKILGVSELTSESATFNGQVTVPEPGGQGFDVVYHFEYSADNGFTWISAPPQDVSLGTTVAGPHVVEQKVDGLLPNFTYRVRLIATTSFVTTSGVVSFTTSKAAPSIVEQRPSADRTTASLQTRIDPNGLPTTYHLEWGTDTSYGHQIPADHNLFVGSGWEPVTFSASIDGLAEATLYHFRVVATNAAGTTVGPDQPFETLAANGLLEDRGIELVSPPDKGPQGQVGAKATLLFSPIVAEDGDSVIFPLLGGTPDADSGGDAIYQATRSSSAWLSTKTTPPSLLPNPVNSALATGPGVTLYSAPDLSCQIVFSFNPLTADTPEADVELGVYNLYIRYADGSYRLITDRVPSNPGVAPISQLGLPFTFPGGASGDCSKVYFETNYHYLPGASALYEWDDGTLRDAGVLPNGAPGVGVSERLLTEGPQSHTSTTPDGSHLAFTATSNAPATSGNAAVFVREEAAGTGDPACATSPRCTVEVSRKQGGSADSLGAKWEALSSDGSHVFFLAGYGLTPTSSSGPHNACVWRGADAVEPTDNRACDLYTYDLENGQLSDLSATSDPANSRGAVVKRVLGVSDNGETVYFAARGQLIAGMGNTYAENAATGTTGSVNIYRASAGSLSFVATASTPVWNLLPPLGVGRAHVTPDGDRLLFEATGNVTGYESGGTNEVYLYSADSEKTVCISCRPDGLPSVAETSGFLAESRLVPASTAMGAQHAISDDGSRAFFMIPDVLAPGAVSGNHNIYEWKEGQVTLLTTGGRPTEIYGASPSGDDVFVRSAERLTGWDRDLALDLYDFRVGGGFPEPPPAAVPCDPAADQCQGTPASQPAASKPVSGDFSGPGNPPVALRCRKGLVKRHGKCVKPHKRRSHHRRHARNRAANANHGGAK